MFFQALWYKQNNKENIKNWFTKNHKIEERSIEPKITWIGHSTFLIQIGGINIITDPVFGNLAGLFKRILPPGLDINSLPPIDFVLLSHNHRDHMDSRSLHMLRKNPGITFLVPQGDKQWFAKRGFSRTIELNWWDKRTFTSVYDGITNLEFFFLPAFHWSGRGIFDRNKSLWGSWLIRCNDKTIYFGGDTAYSSHFKNIQQEFSSIDIAIMPIGPCEPRPWLKNSHIGPEEAGQAFLELNAKHFIPMHWGTYHFGVEDVFLPIELLQKWWDDQKMENKTLHIVKVGQQITPEIQKPFISPTIQQPYIQF
ncbi:MBL fold metallo-hydrolase [Candidatus Dependentiae bacterium]|nr:MBL fold metallo-hydrolase [Candidatus Dependentiae bacterium]